MNKITTTDYPKFKQDTFVHVQKNVGRIQVGEIYTFLEFPHNTIIRQALCVHVRDVELEAITPDISFADLNCDVDIYLEIMALRNIGRTSLLSVGTFTYPMNSKKHYYARISK